MEKTIVTIGGGAKAAALAAFCAARREAGQPAPRVRVAEALEPGANWTGRGGFTDGTLRLGTSPEKDVTYGNDDQGLVGEILRDRYSWASYCQKAELNAEDRAVPTHRQWGDYLASVLRDSGVRVETGWRATGITRKAGRDFYRVALARSGSEYWRRNKSIGGDAVLLTGPAYPGAEAKGAAGATYDSRTFWMHLDALAQGGIKGRKICVTGTGESAGTVLYKLKQMGAAPADVTWKGRRELPSMRVEDADTNRFYSYGNAGEWQRLPPGLRRDFIRATDKGVISPGIMRHIGAYVPRYVQIGSAEEARGACDFDITVNCTGGNRHWFADMIGGLAGDLEAVEQGIDHHLRLPSVMGSRPLNIHVPAIAGLSLGPGYENLSRLGDMAQRVAEAHI